MWGIPLNPTITFYSTWLSFQRGWGRQLLYQPELGRKREPRNRIHFLPALFSSRRLPLSFHNVLASIWCWIAPLLLCGSHLCIQNACKGSENVRIQQIWVQILILLLPCLVTQNNLLKSLCSIFLSDSWSGWEACVHVFVWVCVCLCIYVRLCVYLCVWMYVPVCVSAFACLCVYVSLCTCSYMWCSVCLYLFMLGLGLYMFPIYLVWGIRTLALILVKQESFCSVNTFPELFCPWRRHL